MTLQELKYYIHSKPNGTKFNYSISEPFSWRGSYDEVAFAIEKEQSTREDILAKIHLAYENIFQGYKGGGYRYNDYTDIHFEQSIRDYTDGGYASLIIGEIERQKPYKSQEERLVNLVF